MVNRLHKEYKSLISGIMMKARKPEEWRTNQLNPLFKKGWENMNPGIRQSNSCLVLFNVVLNEIINEVKIRKQKKMKNRESLILCYVNHPVLLGKIENDQQKSEAW